MTMIVFFGVLQLLVSGYACWRGRAPERAVAALTTIAFGISVLVLLHYRDYRSVDWPLLQVDIGLLCGLILVALFADRFWPMWLAALQFVAVATHGVRAYDATIVAWAYWLLVTKIGYFMLLVLVVGVVRSDQRRANGLTEHSWTIQRKRRLDPQ